MTMKTSQQYVRTILVVGSNVVNDYGLQRTHAERRSIVGRFTRF